MAFDILSRIIDESLAIGYVIRDAKTNEDVVDSSIHVVADLHKPQDKCGCEKEECYELAGPG